MKKILILFFFANLLNLHSQEELTKTNTTNLEVDFECGPRVAFYHKSGIKPNFVLLDKWDFFFEGADPIINTEWANFAEEHCTDGFYLQVKLSGEDADIVYGTLESYDSEGNLLDMISNMKLTRSEPNSNKFKSRVFIIVTDEDEVDDDFNNCPEDLNDLSSYELGFVDDVDVDITIFGQIGGTLKGNFESEEEEIDLCGGEDNPIKTVHLNVFIMTQDMMPEISASLVEEQIEMTKKAYAQTCLNFTYSMQLLPVPNGVDLIFGLDYNDLIETNEMKNLVTPIKEMDLNNQEIDVIFLNEFTENSARGFAIADHWPALPQTSFEVTHIRTCFIAMNTASIFTTAHEIGHILSDHGHFGVNYDTNLIDRRFYNLMKGNGTSPCNSPLSSKRLTYEQCNWMRTETDIPQPQ